METYRGTLVFAIILAIAAGTLALSPQFGVKNSIADEIAQLDLPDSIDRQLIVDFVEHKEDIKLWLELQSERGNGNRLPSLTCTACRAAIGLALGLIHQGAPIESIADSLVNLCVTLNIVPKDICRGVVDTYAPPTAFILGEREFLKTNDVCAFLIQNGDCGLPNATLTQWEISLEETNKPPVVDAPLLPKDTPTVQVLQLTDIHLDLNYVEESVADCGTPLCCRDLPTDNSTESLAGHYGDYKCDFPRSALDDLFLDAFRRYDNYSFVLLTGDYTHHAIWATGIEENTRHNEAVAELLKGHFGGQKGPRIFPVIGNHEPHPCNMFVPSSVWGQNSSTGEEFDISWMYSNIADLYEENLPASAMETFRRGGYYTAIAQPGLRLVVLNTNFCYTLNFWIFYDSGDTEGQLQWFADTMAAAEEAGETVYVVGHVPPGHYQCWSHWNVQFNRVINRFENIIKAQFYGHTHEDDLKIFFESSAVNGSEVRPTSSLYIGASATTYTDLNPGYKVYHVDGAETTVNRTWEILNHETFIYNLTQANLQGESKRPEWFQLYTAREAYGLDSLRPADLYELVLRMVNDNDLFQSWYRHFNKASDTMEACDDSDCRLSYLCDIVTTDIKDETHCDVLKSLLNEN